MCVAIDMCIYVLWGLLWTPMGKRTESFEDSYGRLRGVLQIPLRITVDSHGGAHGFVTGFRWTPMGGSTDSCGESHRNVYRDSYGFQWNILGMPTESYGASYGFL